MYSFLELYVRIFFFIEKSPISLLSKLLFFLTTSSIFNTFLEKYKIIPKESIPSSESLEDTYNRVIPYFESKILKLLKSNKNILVTAHGNSIRTLCKYLFKISNQDISNLEIPTGNPLLINFDKNLKIIKVKYLDKTRAKKLLFTN